MDITQFNAVVIPGSNLSSKTSSRTGLIVAVFSLSWQNSGLYVSLGHKRVCSSPFQCIIQSTFDAA